MENEAEDIEQLFEDDLNSLDGFNSGDEEDILGSSIALWEEMINARENDEALSSEAQNRSDGDWSSLMQSVEIQESTWKEIVSIPDIPIIKQTHDITSTSALPTLHELPSSHEEMPIQKANIETRDAVSALLLDMLDSVEYLQSMVAERDDLPPSPNTSSPAQPLLVVPTVFIEEDHVDPLPESADVPEVSIFQSMQAAESLMRQEYKAAIDSVVMRRDTDEEYQREIEADRERRRLRKLKREEEMRRAEEYRSSVLIQSLVRGHVARRRVQRVRHLREQIAQHERKKQQQKELEERRREEERRLCDEQLMQQEDQLALLAREEFNRNRKQQSTDEERGSAQSENENLNQNAESYRRASGEAPAAVKGVSNPSDPNSSIILNKPRNVEASGDEMKATGKPLVAKLESGWGGVIIRPVQDSSSLISAEPEESSATADLLIEEGARNGDPVASDENFYELEGYEFDDDSDLAVVAKVTKLLPTDADVAVHELTGNNVLEEFRSQRQAAACTVRTLEDITVEVARVLHESQEDIDIPALQLPPEYIPTASLSTYCTLRTSPSLWSSWQAWKTYASSYIASDSVPVISSIRNIIATNEPLGDRFENVDNSECMDMSVEELVDASAVSEISGVRVLEMNVNKIATADDFTNCKAQLLALNLKDNALRQINGLSSLTSLRILHLDVNQLTDISPLHSLRNLVHVSMSTNRVEVVPLMRSTKLIRFEAYHNRIATVSCDVLRSMSSLMHLDLGRNKLTEISGVALSQCALLSHLILSQNQLSVLPSPLYLPHLRNFWVSGNKLTDMTSWSPSKGNNPVFLPMLEKLYLQDNLIHRIDPHVFVSCPFLAEVDLSFNNLTSAAALLGLQDCRNLQVLQLQENSVNSQSWLMSWITEHIPSVREISSIAATHHSHAENRIRSNTCSCSLHCAQNNLKTVLHSQMVEQNLVRYRDRRQRTQQETHDRAAKYSNSDTMYDCRVISARFISELFEFDGESTCREVLLREPEIFVPSLIDAEDAAISASHEALHYSNECLHGVTRLQAHFRGRRIRIKIAQLLSDAQYSLDDLDDFSGELLELDAMMQNMPELDDDWIYSKGDGEVAYPKAPLVYGDHRRRSSALSRETKRAFVDEAEPFELGEISTPAAVSGFASRPVSGSTVSSRAHSVSSAINNGDLTERSASSNMDDLARDWGLNSGAVLKAIAKRNNRLKRFEKSKEQRELDKNPTVRYERFLKTAMSTKGNTQTSGSFGGKPKVSRLPKNKKSIPPAWLSMPEEK